MDRVVEQAFHPDLIAAQQAYADAEAELDRCRAIVLDRAARLAKLRAMHGITSREDADALRRAARRT